MRFDTALPTAAKPRGRARAGAFRWRANFERARARSAGPLLTLRFSLVVFGCGFHWRRCPRLCPFLHLFKAVRFAFGEAVLFYFLFLFILFSLLFYLVRFDFSS